MSRMDLLILPTSLLAGFMRRHLVWFSKSGLWSFSVKKAVDSAMGTEKKSAIFDQMGHRQATTSRQKRKTKLHSVPRGKADDHERSFKEHS